MASENNDEKYVFEHASEVERLTLQHEVITDYLGKLVLAPVDFSKPGLRIYDSATADGKIQR